MHDGFAEETKVYRVQGLSCANCAAAFEKNVRSLPSVKEARVNFGAAKLTVVGKATIAELEKAGTFENLKITPDTGGRVPPSRSLWAKKTVVLTAVSAVFLIAALILESVWLCAVSILVGGLPLFRRGLRNLARLRFDINTLMTIAVAGAAAIGEWTEGAVVVILFAVSEMLESFAMDQTRQSIRALMRMAPKEAVVKRDGREIRTRVEDIRIGDVMIVRPGEKIAMDGIVLDGQSFVNEAAISGESMPVAKHRDDRVFAGTLNGDGLLEVRVTKKAEDTTLAKIIHLVEEAQAERAPSQAFVDKFARYYTPAIMLAAAAIATFPPLVGPYAWEDWIYRGLAVLVVGCPCALVISTPGAVITAIGNAARHGVLVKGGIHLEEAGRIRAIAFDKTGTLTKGMPEVTDIVLADESATWQWNEAKVLQIAASLEAGSQHPLAAAIVRKAKENGLRVERADRFQSLAGKGAKAEIAGETYYIGSPRLFAELRGNALPAKINARIEALQKEGKTVVLLGTAHTICALFAITDAIRETSRTMSDKLRALGLRHTVMLTGDHVLTAQNIAKRLNIGQVEAELLPQDKLAVIRKLKQEYSKVAMVGDGVNDAPALAAADIGIAVGGTGTDSALETADIVLMGDDLAKLPFLIRLSRGTLANIRQNITFSLAIKAFALLLVIPGWLTLWIAVAADIGATLLVTLNGMRLLGIKE